MEDKKATIAIKAFSLASHLKTHIHTVHEGRKDYSCESCDKSFSQASNLNSS